MNHTDTIRRLLLEHPFGGPDFGGCECGQIIGGDQDTWANHLAPLIDQQMKSDGWAEPHQIDTPEELDNLPDETVIRDANGEMSMHINVPEKFNPGHRIKWWGDCLGYGENIPVLPATVVYSPEES